MRILVIDEDTVDVPIICDELRQLDNEVLQLIDQSDIEQRTIEFAPQGIVMDLMMAPESLSVSETAKGYTTGAYLYRTVIQPITIGIPFIVFSSAYFGTMVVKHALGELQKFAEYRGIIAKGCDVEEIVRKLSNKGAVAQ